MSTENEVLISFAPGRARVTLNRPSKLNPLDWATIGKLRAAVSEIEARNDIGVVVITGSGRSFSAGGDLEGYLGLYKSPERFQDFLSKFHDLLDTIEASPKIYIAAINGVCVAGGLELLLACDLAVAADTASIGDGHLNFGQLPGAGGSQRLPRAVGLQMAKYLMLTGELLPAAEAHRIGLLCRVFPAAELDGGVDALVDGLLEKSRTGMATAKRLANLTLKTDQASGLKQEIRIVHDYATTHPDAAEGLIAFKEKRKPDYDKG
ncbi:MAG: enoyl-CoA hydratase/isomerase family protein [Rhizomicrobium sp.]